MCGVAGERSIVWSQGLSEFGSEIGAAGSGLGDTRSHQRRYVRARWRQRVRFCGAFRACRRAWTKGSPEFRIVGIYDAWVAA